VSIKNTIRRILKEEKDYTNLITKLLDTIIVSQYEDVCKVEVIAPWNRETISGGKYNDYKVSVYFIGGYGTKNWPNTMALRDKEEKIMDEIWLVVYNMFGVNVDVFSKHVKNCEDTEMIKESNDRTKSLLNKVLRRVNNFDRIVDITIDWCLNHISHSVLKKAGIQWFVERVIYNVYIDYVSPEFEYWGEEGEFEEPELRITKEDEKNITKVLERYYYDKIKKRYIEEIGDEEQITEETKIPTSIRRRFNFGDDDNIFNQLKKQALGSYKYSKDNLAGLVGRACDYTAYIVLDEVPELHEIPDDERQKLVDELSGLFRKRYGKELKEFIDNFFELNNNILGDYYIFWKHADRYGGNGFSDTFESWNDLLRNFASWFPDLDWKEVKKKLDGMVGQPLLIKKPGDKNNNMGYYFSLIKKNTLRENKKPKLKDVLFDMVKDGDLVKAMEITSDLDSLKKILKVDEIDDEYKISAIKKIAAKHQGISLGEAGFEPIHLTTDSYVHKEIAFLGVNKAVLDLWDSKTFDYVNEMTIEYEDLPSNVLDKILKMLLNHPEI
jgi:hypothetical protein